VDRVVLAHQLVQAAVGEHAVPVGVDVQAMGRARSLAVESTRKGTGSRAPGDSTRCASRARNR
jgi:hypothetical protein